MGGSVKKGVKKQIFYGQADRKRLPPPTPPYGQLWNFFWCVFILDYDSMCSEMDFTQEKSFLSNYNYTAALSQNSQIAL